jgi:hypothetical protein
MAVSNKNPVIQTSSPEVSLRTWTLIIFAQNFSGKQDLSIKIYTLFLKVSINNQIDRGAISFSAI